MQQTVDALSGQIQAAHAYLEHANHSPSNERATDDVGGQGELKLTKGG